MKGPPPPPSHPHPQPVSPPVKAPPGKTVTATLGSPGKTVGAAASPGSSAVATQSVAPAIASPGGSVQVPSQMLSQDSTDTLHGEDRPSDPKKPRKEDSAPRAMRMQVCGVIVKDSRKAELGNAVGARWDVGNYSTVHCLTGTNLSTKQQTVLVYPEGRFTDMMQLMANMTMLTVINVVGAIDMVSPPGYESYDSFMVGREPVTVEAATASGDMMPAVAKGKVFEYKEEAAVKFREVKTLAGYMRAPVSPGFRPNSPGKAVVFVGGDPDQEVVVNIWGACAKAFAVQHLPVGPVIFNVTVSKGRNGMDYNCNVPHCGRPLGGPLAAGYTQKALASLDNVVQGTFTAMDVVADDDGRVVGVTVRVVPDVDPANAMSVVVRDGVVANHMFGAFVPLPVGQARNVLKWCEEHETHIHLLSVQDIRGEIRTGSKAADTEEVTVVGFKPTF